MSHCTLLLLVHICSPLLLISPFRLLPTTSSLFSSLFSSLLLFAPLFAPLFFLFSSSLHHTLFSLAPSPFFLCLLPVFFISLSLYPFANLQLRIVDCVRVLRLSSVSFRRAPRSPSALWKERKRKEGRKDGEGSLLLSSHLCTFLNSKPLVTFFAVLFVFFGGFGSAVSLLWNESRDGEWEWSQGRDGVGKRELERYGSSLTSGFFGCSPWFQSTRWQTLSEAALYLSLFSFPSAIPFRKSVSHSQQYNKTSSSLQH